MRLPLILCLMAALAVCGCTSIKKKAALNNPPPIAASGGPMDPNKPDAVAGQATTPTPGEVPPGGDGAAPAPAPQALPAVGGAAPAPAPAPGG